MAKSKKAPSKAAKDPLEGPLQTFSEGDYVSARAQLEALGAQTGVADSTRAASESLVAATQVDRTTLYVGLTCLGVFCVAVLLVSTIQP